MAQKHLSRLVAALTDFHKAQCFFMLAINIAALVVIQRGGFDPQSLQQMYNTYLFLRVLAVNGFLPITFTLTNLYLVGMLSWFLTLLSSVTIALSVATLASAGQFNPSVADMTRLAELAASGGPEECDGRKPGIYCMRTTDYGWIRQLWSGFCQIRPHNTEVRISWGSFLSNQLDFESSHAFRAVDPWIRMSTVPLFRCPTNLRHRSYRIRFIVGG